MLISRMNLIFKVKSLTLLLMIIAKLSFAMSNGYCAPAIGDTLILDSLIVTTVQEEKVQPRIVLSASDKKQILDLLNASVSYEKKLEHYVNGAIEFDRKTGFNPFVYINWNQTGMKNNFVYEYVPFRRSDKRIKHDGELNFSIPIKLNNSLLTRSSLNSHLFQSWDAFEKARQNVYTYKPDLVVCHWDNLPDPPAMVDTVFLPLINEVDLSFDLQRSYVGKDHKIEGYKQEQSPWTFKGISSLHTTETLVSNWAKGGQNSVSILGITNFDANYQMKDLKWENDFEVKLGYLFYSEEEDGESVNQNQKNADVFQINSKVGYKAFKNWYYTAALNLNSQFFDGKDKKNENIISGFLSPGQVYLAAGMDYKYKKLFSVFVSPLTYKNTLVIDPDEAIRKRYGIEDGERSKKEVGGYVRGSLKWDINDDFTWTSKVYLFSNYKENPENVDVDFENILDYNFSHVFSLRFFVHMKYDDNTKFEVGTNEDGTKHLSPRLQFQQQMSIGLFYRF